MNNDSTNINSLHFTDFENSVKQSIAFFMGDALQRSGQTLGQAFSNLSLRCPKTIRSIIKGRWILSRLVHSYSSEYNS